MLLKDIVELLDDDIGYIEVNSLEFGEEKYIYDGPVYLLLRSPLYYYSISMAKVRYMKPIVINYVEGDTLAISVIIDD